MTVLYFAICFVASIVLQLVAMVFAPAIALFVDKDGNLPYWLRWFQTPDSTCYDTDWVATHPTWSKYLIALTWIARNPAGGFQKAIGITVTEPVTLHGNINISDTQGISGWYLLVDATGKFQFTYVIQLFGAAHCARGELGWYLKPIIDRSPSANTGMLLADPVRFYNFGTQGQ